MLFQPKSPTPPMTNDVTLNKRGVEQDAWLVGNRLQHAFTSDFVWHPQDKAWIYAPGWQTTPGLDLDNAFGDYFTRTK